jgi:hypothetical protein
LNNLSCVNLLSAVHSPPEHSPSSPLRSLLLLPCGALQLYYYRKGQLDDFRDALEAVTTDEAMEAMTHGACVCVHVRACVLAYVHED